MIKFYLKTFLTLAVMLSATALRTLADETQTALVVWQGDEEIYSLYIVDTPELTVENGNAIIKSDGTWTQETYFETHERECYITLPLSETANYRLTFEKRNYSGERNDTNTEVGINDIPAKSVHTPGFSMQGGVLTVHGMEAGTQLSVTSVDGRLIGKATSSSDGEASVSIRDLRGTAIVNAGKVSFKIMVR